MKRSPLSIILFVAFVDLVGFGLIIPLQAVYAERLGATGLTFGLLIGVYSIMQFVFNPILGRWSDRVGRRRVLLISMAGSVISHALLGVADLAHSLPLLFVARTLDGITGANVATAQAYIADVTTDENRARGMGLFGAAFGLGFVLGPAIGAGLAGVGGIVGDPRYATAWPAFGATFISAIAFVLVWRHLPESRRPTADEEETRFFSLHRLREAMTHDRLRELFVLSFGVTFAFVLLEATLVYLCRHRFDISVSGTGLLFAYIGTIMVIVQGGLVGRLVARFGEMRLLAWAPFITATGFVLLAAVPMIADVRMAWVMLFVGCIPTALGQGLTGPNLNALISRQAARERQGLTMGLSQGVGSLARAVGPPIAGYLYDIGPSRPYLVGAGVLGIFGAFAVSIRGRQQRSLRATTSATTADPAS